MGVRSGLGPAGACLAWALLLTGCAASGPESVEGAAPEGRVSVEPTTPPQARTSGPGGEEYRPGRAVTVARPTGPPSAVVVLVPGGSWMSADPTGMQALAAPLVEDGLATVTIIYGTWGTGDHHPVPEQDVACAVAYAATQVPDVPVVLVGHSAGAHLVALVGLVPDQGGDCPHPARPADGVVGLAGPYDVTRTGGMAANLFGVGQDEDPDAWTEGNPLAWVGTRPELPFLLVHGEDDRVVPMFFTDDLDRALTAAGHEVEVVTYPGVDHMEVIEPEVVADDVVRWVSDTVVGG